MKRRITIEINAGPKTCWPCKWLAPNNWCCLFFDKVNNPRAGERHRCSECLAAEAKAKGEQT